MGLWDFLDDRPLEPADLPRVRAVAEGVVGTGKALVQSIGGAEDRFLGSVRVVDLEVQRLDRDHRAARIRDALRRAGYEAHLRSSGRSPWPDVEVTCLSAAEWRRRRRDAATSRERRGPGAT